MTKYLFIAVIIILIIGGVFYIVQNSKSSTTLKENALTISQPDPTMSPVEESIPTNTPTTQPEPTLESKDKLPMQVVGSYYQTFTECMKNPPAAATGHVSVYCQEHNDYAGIDLPANLDKEAKKGNVPVICAQTPPESAEPVSASEVTETTATVLFKENFGTTSSIEITYSLSPEGEGNTWKVQNIICPTL